MPERLYYADSFLKTFAAAVTDIREHSRAEGGSIWQLSLDRTAFYPTSGGQPFDLGVLRAHSRGGLPLEIAVEGVEEDESGEVWHTIRKPLAAGTQVEGTIDWERRLDHMQQHTGQHLLSAVFLRELDAATVSFHLGESSSTIDIAHGPLAQHSQERIERLVNEIVAEDRPVTVRFAGQEEAKAMLEAGELRKLPEREGEIRIVNIADCDRNACGGTHVRSTGQIGGLLIRSTEKVTRGTRVEFVCGLRAVRAAREDAALLTSAATALSVGAPDVATAIEKLKSDSKALVKDRQRLREEVAAYHAARLAVEFQIRSGLRLIDRCWKDRDREYVRILASRAVAAAPSTVALLCADERTPARVYLARSLEMQLDCGRVLKETLAQFGLRGGGSADLAQGDVPAEQLTEVRSALVQAVRATVGTPG